jgi:glycosyltransferase involved in cell wall biosynthesis
MIGAPGFTRHCLFPDRNYGDLSARKIGNAVQRKLDELRPGGVGINGWRVPEARAALAWCEENGRTAVAFSETLPDGDRRWWREWVKSRVVHRFDAALVGGEPHRNYVERLGMPPERVFLGYDAVDNDYFRARSEGLRAGSGEISTRNGLPERYFFCSTRFLPRKNIDGLLRAYAVYRSRVDRPWNLVIAGSGETGDANRALSLDLSIADHVHWPGFLQYGDLPIYYALASAFIHPAKSEPWGLVVNEACASGLPILVSRTVGARYELVRQGDNGLIFDPFDVDDMAEKMTEMTLLSPQARELMGRRSQEIVSLWGPERFADALWAAFEVAEG